MLSREVTRLRGKSHWEQIFRTKRVPLLYMLTSVHITALQSKSVFYKFLNISLKKVQDLRDFSF